MPTRRRDVLIAAASVGLVIALPKLWNSFGKSFRFDPIPGLPGFRRLPTGVTSGGDSVLVGLQPISEMQAQMRQEVSAAPCRMLFGDTEATDEQIQVAVFSDYNCPYCRVLSRMVKRLMDEGVPIRVTWHDLPVLGPRSEAAARAALAAAEQGAYLQVHQRLMQTILRPGTVHLVKLAGEFGLDEDRFVRDATGPKTERSIERAKAIAAVFGIAGTPALMVGRTLVVGEIDEASLQKLVQLELEHPDDPCLKG